MIQSSGMSSRHPWLGQGLSSARALAPRQAGSKSRGVHQLCMPPTPSNVSHAHHNLTQAAPEGSGRKFKVGPMALRTWWFDQRLLTLLESGKQGPGPRQVVVLGAGMDTRPWRLQLPLGEREMGEMPFTNVRADLWMSHAQYARLLTRFQDAPVLHVLCIGAFNPSLAGPQQNRGYMDPAPSPLLRCQLV